MLLREVTQELTPKQALGSDTIFVYSHVVAHKPFLDMCFAKKFRIHRDKWLICKWLICRNMMLEILTYKFKTARLTQKLLYFSRGTY